jgi:hypothetical protein
MGRTTRSTQIFASSTIRVDPEESEEFFHAVVVPEMRVQAKIISFFHIDRDGTMPIFPRDLFAVDLLLE